MTPTMTIPQVSAPTLLALCQALHTALHAAQAAQVQTSEAQAANTRGRRRQENEPVTAVPVPIAGGVTSCMRRLDGACATLAQARRDGASRSEGRPRRVVRQRLPGRYRKAWGAVVGLLAVWRKAGVLDELPEASRHALERVFGADFAAPSMRGGAGAAWVRGGELMARMKADGVDALITSLGGGRVLANLGTVHAEVGAAFGMTAAVPVASAGASAGDAASAVRSLVREYALKVSAMVDPEVPGSDALAATLLAPLDELCGAPRPAKAKRPAAQQPKQPAAPPQNTPSRGATEPAKDATPLRPTG